MRKLTLSSVAGIFVLLMIISIGLSPSSASAGSFEGVIGIKSSGMMGGGTTKYFIKAGKQRLETSFESSGGMAGMMGMAGNSITIMDEEKKKTYSVFEDRKEYTEGDLTDVPIETVEDTDDVAQNMPEKTGKTKDILGYSCEQWVQKMKSEEGEIETEIWVADGVPVIEGVFDEQDGASNMPGGMEGKMPLLMFIRGEGGAEMMRWEITEIDEKKLDDSLFLPPAGYKKVDNSMPKGMEGMEGFDSDEILKSLEGMEGLEDLKEQLKELQNK